MKYCHVNDGVNRIQKQGLRPRNRNFYAGILTDAPALVAAASNIALIPSIVENSRKNYICVKNTKSAKVWRKILLSSFKILLEHED